MTITYLIAGLHVYAVYLFIRNGKVLSKKLLLKKVVQIAMVFAIPYIVWMLYFLVTGSMRSYYFDTITFNQQYYIYNYPLEPGGSINPIRYALIIAHDFINNFFPVIGSVKNLAFDFPLVNTFAMSHIAFMVILLITRRYVLIYPYLVLLVYSNTRSNPASIAETDYQVNVYIFLSMIVGLYSFQILKQLLDTQTLTKSFRILAGSVFVLLSAYWFFTSIFLPLKFNQIL